MKTTEGFSTLNAEQLRETTGGGFAYDIGRVIRLIGFTGAGGTNVYKALIDWVVNDTINDAVNG
jgi:hypothetical protein